MSGEEALDTGTKWLIISSRGSELLKDSGIGCHKVEGHIYGWKENLRFRNTIGIRLIISEIQPNLSFLLKGGYSIGVFSNEKIKLYNF